MKDKNKIILFSIRGKFCDKIYSGEKKVEFRRKEIKLKKDEKCLIYTSYPVKEITGFFIVKKTESLPLNKLWEKTKKIAGGEKKDFLKYYIGKKEGFAIYFKDVKRFKKGLSLDKIRAAKIDFTPPVSYCYLEDVTFNKIKKLGKFNM